MVAPWGAHPLARLATGGWTASVGADGGVAAVLPGMHPAWPESGVGVGVQPG